MGKGFWHRFCQGQTILREVATPELSNVTDSGLSSEEIPHEPFVTNSGAMKLRRTIGDET